MADTLPRFCHVGFLSDPLHFSINRSTAYRHYLTNRQLLSAS